MTKKSARESAGDDAPKTLAPPRDARLAEAISAFERGNYREARALDLASVDDVDDDRIHVERLERALGWEPSLWIAAALVTTAWVIIYFTVS